MLAQRSTEAQAKPRVYRLR